jgi:cytochrome c oxidase cbb3-type subunit 3
MADHRKIDEVTGTETTGHEWDGIAELNTPLPRWWLWVWYACIVWAIGYWIAMPAWPLIAGHSTGVLGYSQRTAVTERLAEAEAARAEFGEGLLEASLEEARTDPTLLEFALAGGRSAFLLNCSQCHGTGAAGAVGYPNLNDDDWLWGGTIDDIHQTIAYGIRSDHEDARINQMPGFLLDESLTREEVDQVADYVLSLSEGAGDTATGAELFVEWCAMCHGDSGEGIAELGAPNLSDAIWLYGGEKDAVVRSISNGRGGMMPAWEQRLSPLALKQLAIYVHSLGGGE